MVRLLRVLALAMLIVPALAADAQSAGRDIGARPAKQAFGHIKKPAALSSRALGSYVRGCLAGGKMLPINGPAWQVMRLSRNRNWGHPVLIRYLERLARDVHKRDGWPGLMVGDMAQPRGGPMLTGHRSHQIGLDADIWLKPMPAHHLSAKARETISAVSMLGPDKLSVNPKVWSQAQVRLLKRAASYPEVARIFVHPAIKQALCHAAGSDRGWLSKIRPWWGHHYHFHVRLKCPASSPGCVDQKPPAAKDGCGKELAGWLKLLRAPPKPKKPGEHKKPKKRKPLTVADLPDACRGVLEAPSQAAASAHAPVPPLPVRAVDYRRR